MVELTNLNYLTREQLMFQNDITLLQLSDCTLNVASKNSSEAISEMFSTELKFTADSLLGFFKKKIKSNNLELSNEQKIKYETQNSIDWEKDHCCICPFPLQINPTNMINMKNTKNILQEFLRSERTQILGSSIKGGRAKNVQKLISP